MKKLLCNIDHKTKDDLITIALHIREKVPYNRGLFLMNAIMSYKPHEYPIEDVRWADRLLKTITFQFYVEEEIFDHYRTLVSLYDGAWNKSDVTCHVLKVYRDKYLDGVLPYVINPSEYEW